MLHRLSSLFHVFYSHARFVWWIFEFKFTYPIAVGVVVEVNLRIGLREDVLVGRAPQIHCLRFELIGRQEG